MSRRHHRPWSPGPEDRAIARSLGPGVAFVPVDGGVGFVAGGALELALAVWERFPGRAHAVLRSRIRITAPVTALDRAVAQVVAKRVTWVAGEPGAGGSRATVLVTPRVAEGTAGPGGAERREPTEPVRCEDLRSWLDRARARAREAAFDPGMDRVPTTRGWLDPLVPVGEPRPLAERDRPVVAVLVGPDGAIVWAARNAGGQNRVLHAECCLVLGYGRPLPAGSTLWVSLQPCRMCAALIVARAEGPLRVIYTSPDPGPLARGTALQRSGWEEAEE